MKKTEITEQKFERLLDWLDPNREMAGRRYEAIRERLVQIFYARGFFVAAEDLADETMDRVTRKAEDLMKTYQGEPALFFYGVAKLVFLEFTRTPKFEELPPTLADKAVSINEAEEYQVCLEKCLENLARDQCELIIGYYEGEKQEKIDQRKKLQLLLGITSEALRVKALRIRLTLQKCVVNCTKGNVG